jgi:hypothetical protein
MFTPDTPHGMDAADRALAAIENLLCSETQAWLQREIEALRFTKAH